MFVVRNVLSGLLLAAALAAPALATVKPVSVASPTTRYTAQVQDLGSFGTEDFAEKFHKYRIDFLGPGKRKVASTVYAARYGAAVDDRIRTPKDVKKRLIWDKRERYVLVMNTETVTMSGTDVYDAFALDPSLKWKQGEFALDHATWVTPKLAIGERRSEDRVAVAVFDLTTGQTRTLHDEEGYHGYRIERRTPHAVTLVRCDHTTRKPMGSETLVVTLSNLTITKGKR